MAEAISLGQGSDYTEFDSGSDYQLDVRNAETAERLLSRSSVSLQGDARRIQDIQVVNFALQPFGLANVVEADHNAHPDCELTARLLRKGAGPSQAECSGRIADSHGAAFPGYRPPASRARLNSGRAMGQLQAAPRSAASHVGPVGISDGMKNRQSEEKDFHNSRLRFRCGSLSLRQSPISGVSISFQD